MHCAYRGLVPSAIMAAAVPAKGGAAEFAFESIVETMYVASEDPG